MTFIHCWLFFKLKHKTMTYVDLWINILTAFFLLLIFTRVTFLMKAAYRRESLSVLMVPERSLGSIMAGAAWQQVAHMRARAESWEQKAHIWNCKQEVERANWERCNTFEAHPQRHTAFRKITPPKVPQTARPNEDQVFKHPNLRGTSTSSSPQCFGVVMKMSVLDFGIGKEKVL